MNLKDKRKIVISVIFAICVIIACFFAWRYWRDRNNSTYNKYDNSTDILARLRQNPRYLEEVDLLYIKEKETFEYFRERLLYHNYTNPSNPQAYLKEELELDFPGEKGKILSELLQEYIKFEDKKKEIEKNLGLDEFQKIIKTNELKINQFGTDLAPLFFPPKDSEKIEKFYAYTFRYLAKHKFDDPRSKFTHLEKARKEIYGENFERIFDLESPQRLLDLEIRINERELGILSPSEKQERIKEMSLKYKRQ